ncbi:MAG: TonB-dependent receptor [Bacteroidota bacterium]
MKLTVFLFFVTIMGTLAAESYSQSTKLTLDIENSTVKEILNEIEDQSEFRFFYSSSVDVERKTSVSKKNSKIFKILDNLFEGTDVNYEVYGRQIALVSTGETFEADAVIQQKSVTGKVTDELGEPLPGVTVLVKGTTTGAVTNMDGNFTIPNIQDGAVLHFSFVGMLTQEIEVGNQTTINVTMVADAIGLEEVIAIGYGTQKKVNLTGSLTTVSAEKVENRPITSATQMLSGFAPGVNVTQRSGRPGGDDAIIRIRGVGTLGNNNPLIIVDGLAGSLSNVNPADIESITVLKDAASSAIYGSRAANGVILVTTKKGKAGKLRVNYDAYAGAQKATRLTDYVTNSVQFMELYNKALLNENPSATPLYSQSIIDEFRTGTDPYLYPNTDWNDEMYSVAGIQSHNVRVSGGNDQTNYSFSLGYIDQDGVLMGTNAKQYSTRLNLDSRVNEKLSYSVKVAARHDDVNEAPVGSGSITGWANRALPYYGTRLEDGKWAGTWVGNSTQNAIAAVTEGINKTGEDNFVFNLSGVYEIIEGLKYTGTVGYSKRHSLQKIFRPKILIYNPKTLTTNTQGSGGPDLSADNRYIQDTDLTLISTLDYNKTFAENHNLEVLAGFQQETSRFDYLAATKSGIPSNELHEIDAGSVDPTSRGYRVNYGLQSFFGRTTYNYKQKYLVEANVRYDGSSNFADGKRWGIFPSVSVGWNIAEEDFLKNNDIINGLKLRGSWGELGNQNISPNQFSATYSLGQNYSQGGALVGGAAQTNLPNAEVTWETSMHTDIGVDLVAYDGKLGLVVEYFDKLTKDILRPISISTVIGGLTPPTVNLASVRNTGFELDINHRNKINDFSYEVGFNLTTIKNEVVEIPAPKIGGYTRIAEGSPIDEFYVIKMIGIFQDEAEIAAHGAQPDAKPGDVKFEDLDGNGVIDGDDRQPIGSSIPNLLFGCNLNVKYKGFDFSALAQGVGGVLAITEHEQKPFFNSAGLPQFWVENAWTEENKNNEYPRLTRSSNYMNNGWRNSSFLLEDASFVRIKNIQLGYSVSGNLLNKLKLDRLRVYLNAQNPFLFTKYRGLDPEKSVTAGRGSYTNVSIYSIGLNVSF